MSVYRSPELEKIMIFSKTSEYRKYQKYPDNHDIFAWKYHDTIVI